MTGVAVDGLAIVHPEDAPSFDKLPGHTMSRSGRMVDKIVLHWDVCMSSEQCYRVLAERNLSIHFTIAQDGQVVQWLPLAAAAYHAGSIGYNRRSIGIEINNPYYQKYQKTKYGEGRNLVSDKLPHSGKLHRYLDFTAEQKVSALLLCHALCDILHLRKTFALATGLADAGVIRKSTVVGHYHISRAKIDPGFTLWPVLESGGFEPISSG